MSTKILYPDTAGLDYQDTPCQGWEHSWLISLILAKSGEIELEKDDITINIWHLSYVADDDDQAGLLGAECGVGSEETNNYGVREFEIVGRYIWMIIE